MIPESAAPHFADEADDKANVIKEINSSGLAKHLRLEGCRFCRKFMTLSKFPKPSKVKKSTKPRNRLCKKCGPKLREYNSPIKIVIREAQAAREAMKEVQQIQERISVHLRRAEQEIRHILSSKMPSL